MSKSSVFLLCGGRGKRLNSKTSHMPKALVPVNNRPILSYILEQFRSQDFKNFIFGTGYLSSMIEGFLAKEPKGHSSHYTISDAGESASMLGRIWHARESYTKYVIVVYGDTFIDIKYEDLLKAHMDGGGLMTLMTGQIQNPFGVVTIDSSLRITSFVEKPIQDQYIGCFVFNREALDEITPAMLDLPDGDGLVYLFNVLAKTNKLQAFRHKGLQITFNTEHELQNANSAFKDYYTVREN
jgi:NDP-sugar pyrophosphorylase family protein